MDTYAGEKAAPAHIGPPPARQQPALVSASIAWGVGPSRKTAATPADSAALEAAVATAASAALACLFGDGQEILLSWAKNASVLDGFYLHVAWPEHAIRCLRNKAVRPIQKEQIAIQSNR